MNRTFLFLLILIIGLPLSAQTDAFQEKIKVSNHLFKVKNDDRWGLIDNDNNLILSVEYNEPYFKNGKAVITEYRTNQLAGVADTFGVYKPFPPYYINTVYPYVSDGMLAVRETPNGKWGFLNTETGSVLSVNIQGFNTKKNGLFKRLGINGKKVKGKFVFDVVAPFVEGLAVVNEERIGWVHIDTDGNERFKVESESPTMFRSSLNNGEAILFCDKGIVLCRETLDDNAGVIRILEDEYEIKDYSANLLYPYVIRSYGNTLKLNSEFQVETLYRSNGDSIVFIEKLHFVPVEEPTDSFTLGRDIEVKLPRTTISAGSRGTASVTLDVANIGEFDSDELTVTVDINGTTTAWEGTIAKGASQQIAVIVPARFSAPSVSREVVWTIQCGQTRETGHKDITIKRYRPSRR